MHGVIEFLFMGIFLGLSAGISPGPLMAMTISETLQHGPKEGMKVAVSPLMTDILIVSAIMLFLLKFEEQSHVIALISMAGAIYLISLGISSLRTKDLCLEILSEKRNSLKKGILVNFLSPHPYLFWIVIGGPIMFQALDVDILAIFLFVLGFYAFLVGSKIMIALLVGRSRSFLVGNYYLYIIHGLGLVYIIFALFFIKQGLELLDMNIL